ncbi:hypothetical protein LIER_21653 [Lithospermum erythrorhizon]|uniref:Uncharacterized protein n=1 Tax=Lithospermum erythrorhizon TaxID=34254 RepID=A0AAV3QSJ2_LITER
MVMGWLINSMEPEINRKYMYLQTAKEIWDGTQKVYSDRENPSQMFKTRQKLKDLKQGNFYVTSYFSKLQDYGRNLTYTLKQTLYVQIATSYRPRRKKKKGVLGNTWERKPANWTPRRQERKSFQEGGGGIGSNEGLYTAAQTCTLPQLYKDQLEQLYAILQPAQPSTTFSFEATFPWIYFFLILLREHNETTLQNDVQTLPNDVRTDF